MISLNFGYVIHHYNIKCSLYFHDIAECVRLRRDESRKFCLIDFSMELQYKRFYCSYIFQIISRLQDYYYYFFLFKFEKGFSKPDNFSSSKKSSRHLIKSWTTRNCTSWIKKNCNS